MSYKITTKYLGVEMFRVVDDLEAALDFARICLNQDMGVEITPIPPKK